MFSSFPFTGLSSRWVLKAWYNLSDYWFNWDPVKNSNNKIPRSLKGTLMLFLLRSHQQSQCNGLFFPHLDEWHGPASSSHNTERKLASLKSGVCHYLLNRYSRTLYIKSDRDSKTHSIIRFLFCYQLWTLQEATLHLCRCLSPPLNMESCLHTLLQGHMRHLYCS